MPDIVITPSLTAKSNEFTVNTETFGDQVNTRASALEGGGFVIVWYSRDTDVDGSERGVAGRVYDESGAAVGSEFTVNTKADGDQTQTDVQALSGGGFIVTWRSHDITVDGNSSGISAQMFNATGAKVGAEFTVNTEVENAQTNPTVVALTNGNAVITWVSADTDVDGNGTGIAAQIFSSAGAKVGSEFTVNSNASGDQLSPFLVALEGGGFVVTWYSHDPAVDANGTGISAQIYSATGTKVGNEFTVNTNTTGDQLTPTAAALDGGGFVIVWYGDNSPSDSDTQGISGQKFDATGNKVGSEFTVNTNTTGGQYAPEVAPLKGGGFVVTWHGDSAPGDSSSSGVSGQIFDSSGAKVDGEFLLNTETSSTQAHVRLGGLGDHSFVASWQSLASSADGSGAGIVARVFDVNATALNVEPTNSNNTVTATEDTAYTFKTSDFNFADSDNGNILQSVRIDTTTARLTLNDTPITNTQVVAVADITAGNLKYTPSANQNGTDLANFEFSVSDGTAFSTSKSTMTIDVAAVNDAPTINITDSSVEYTEHVNTYIDGSGTVSDIEGDSEWDGGSLKAQITANADSNDRLVIYDGDSDTIAITQSNTVLSANVNGAGDVQVGTISGLSTSNASNGGDAYTITFNSNTTSAIVQETLQSFQMANLSNDPSPDSRTITFTVTDTHGASGSDTRTVTINALNDDPSQSGSLPSNATANVAAASSLDLSNMNINDADLGNSGILAITFKASIGTITATFDAKGPIHSLTGSGTDTVVISGSLTALNDYFDATASNDRFQYTGPAGVTGTDAAKITITGNDGGNSGSGGGTDVSFGNFDIDIVVPNTPPTSVNSTLNATEDITYTFESSDFTFNDTDTGDTLKFINISTTNLAAGDKLTYDGSDVSNDTISPSELDGGSLKYIPAANAFGAARSTFTFIVQDNHGTNSTTSYTYTINVADVAEPGSGSGGSSNSGGSSSSGSSSGSSSSSSGTSSSTPPITAGSSSTDTLEGSTGNDTIDGGSGSDILRGGEGDDSVLGGDGNDEIFAGPNDAGADTLQGNRGGDVIGGGAGDDLIVGGDASDNLDLNNLVDAGNDTLFGGAGNDFIVGGSFNTQTQQVANTGEGENFIWAGSGDDTVFGDDKDDKLGGGEGSDLINAGAGSDVLYGGRGGPDVPNDDTLNGGDGADQVFASIGQDNIDGGNGSDTLFAGAGDDTVDGGADDDIIWGGTGDDNLTGGDGDDTFSFITGFGTDIISDFSSEDGNSDTLDLSGIESLTLINLRASATFSDGNTILTVADHGSLILEGINEDALDAIMDAGQILVS